MKPTLAELLHSDCPCGGLGKCGKCKIRVSGELSAPTEAEKRLLGDQLNGGWRLACQTVPLGEYSVGKAPEADRIVRRGRGKLAVDIGTTTLEARLITPDVRIEVSALNPQRRFGADVITRIGAAETHADELTNELREAISALTDGFEYDEAVVTGNTVMLHFFAGLDVRKMAGYPFEPTSLFGEWIDGRSVGLHGMVYLPRCVSAFVGADTVCALIAADLKPSERSLLIDLGTNGEIVYSADRLICSSTAAGPALEGADISSGMRAVDGAVDRVEYFPGNDREGIRVGNGVILPHVIGGKAPRGICGSGLISLIAALLDAGVIDESGYLEEPFELAPGVSLTPKDVRAFQLAKSAIRTGIALIGGENADRLLIAGNFGRGLDLAACRRTGLLPDSGTVEILGNAALTGAELILSGATDKFDIEWLDLAANERFDELFTENLLFGGSL